MRQPPLFSSPGARAIATLAALPLAACLFPLASSAQIIPDATLPVNSTVRQEGNSFAIDGGTRAGANLFHSFDQFSISTGDTAYFNNDLSVQNILTRITGESGSNIDGLIRANGTANLFLLNANGIIFGRNASLELGGSFIGSTASSLQFADGTSLSTRKEAIAPPLLSVSVPVGLGFGSTPAPILNQSRATIQGNTVGLQVLPGKTIALIGGDITLEGGYLTAPSGRIELGSVAGSGKVSLTPTDKNFALGYENVESFQDIHLSEGSTVSASGAGGGEIQVQGRRVSVTQGSQIVSITQGSEKGGTLTVNASEKVEVTDNLDLPTVNGEGEGNLIPTRVSSQTQSSGDAGDLTITTKQLIVRDSIISAATLSEGAGGNLTVRALDSVEVSASSVDGVPRGLVNASLGAGNAGELTIETGRLMVRDGAFVASGTRSSGNGGNLIVRASESVEAIGTSPDGKLPTLIQSAATDGPESVRMRYGPSVVTGNASNLTIDTRRLIVRNGAKISTGTDGSGRGGNLTIRALDSVELSGRGLGNIHSSFLSDSLGTGAAGDLTIETGQLIVQDGAFVSASTFGPGQGGNLTVRAQDSVEVISDGTGNFFRKLSSQTFEPSDLENGLFTASFGTGAAGDLTITTRRLALQKGAGVLSTAFGFGQGGSLTVNASDSVELISPGGGAISLLFSGTQSNGDGGDLTIATSRLILQFGAVSVATFGEGRGGNLAIVADESIEIHDGLISSQTVAGTVEAGNLTIDTRKLLVDGSGPSGVSASTFGPGQGGNLVLNASESVELIGTSPLGHGLFARSRGTGNAGSLTVNTQKLIVRDGAEVTVASTQSGAAGNLAIRASSVLLDNGGTITAATNSGAGGDITLQASDIQLRRNSNITTNAGSTDGGNIAIETDTLLGLENSDITANARAGRGGRAIVNASGIFGYQFGEQDNPGTSDITATSELGPQFSGTVKITTPDVQLQNGLFPLSEELVGLEQVVANSCLARRNGERGSFTVTGTGGLPATPYDAIAPRYAVTGVERVGTGDRGRTFPIPNTQYPITPSWKLGDPIQEARGMVVTADGRTLLKTSFALAASAGDRDLLCHPH